MQKEVYRKKSKVGEPRSGISSVLARSSSEERCCPRDQSIAVVSITFFQPHQKIMVYLRVVELHSSAL